MNERMDEGINSGFSLAQRTSAVRSVNAFIFAAYFDKRSFSCYRRMDGNSPVFAS